MEAIRESYKKKTKTGGTEEPREEIHKVFT